MIKENYQAVLDQIALIAPQLDTLQDQVIAANPEATDVASEVVEAKDNLIAVSVWATQEIDKLNQEVVINSFLSEIKAVFEKYHAKLEVASGDAGYGEGYGEGSAVGVTFTATVDGVTGVKEIGKSVIVAEDLV